MLSLGLALHFSRHSNAPREEHSDNTLVYNSSEQSIGIFGRDSHLQSRGLLHAMAAGAPDATIDSLLSRPLSPGIRRKPVPPSLHHWDKEYTSLPLVTSENGSYHEKQPETHLAAHRSFGALLASWKLELLSVALSYASFITIAATLGSFQGKLATTWRMPISINAVVSIFSIIFKASLVLPITEGISQLKWLWLFQESRSLVDVDRYDQASRGPWGSARLIARQFVDRKRS